MPCLRGCGLFLLAASVLVAWALPGQADTPRLPQDAFPVFERDIRPILKARCFHCHGEGEELKGEVDLRLRRFMASTTTDSGRVLTPSSLDESRIVALIRSGEMPKGEKKLSPEERERIEAWIAAGAPTARPEPVSLPHGFGITEEERQFWSFQPIVRPSLPVVHKPLSHRVRTPIDAFIAAALQEKRMAFAPDAERLTLIQRVYLDLLGLPPSPREVAAFLGDSRPDAYERLVDRVLDSPRYGERWGRHWLDIAGYADSNGYAEADSERRWAWRYRDYVIRSFNRDKPWNTFVVEQLAGDELAGATQENASRIAADAEAREQLIATGFLRLAPDGTDDEVMDRDLARNQVLAAVMEIVSTSLTGLTVACAQCHDHRYDPISQADYYQLRAVFEPAFDWKHWRSPQERLFSLSTEADRAKADEIEAAAKKIDEAAHELRRQLLDEVFEKELAELPEALREDARKARAMPRDKRSPEQIALFKEYPSADVQGALDLYDPQANAKVQAKLREAGQLRGTKPPEPMIMATTEIAGTLPETFVFHRGDHESPRQRVEPAVLDVLKRPGWASLQILPVNDDQLASSGRRLAYSRWLTSGQHPLVARVLANRFWLHHFGSGLVATPADFGMLGERPTHPELLDWLSHEFMSNGWRLKPLHRLILTSTVYRQSSRNDASTEADRENRWYGRWKLRRLEAEAVRDAILSVSGALNAPLYGEPVPIAQDAVGRVVTGAQKNNSRGDPTIVTSIGQEAFRRSIYVQARRSLPLTILEAFDSPVMLPNCESRNVSVVPAQTLAMLNDSFVAEQSLLFAERLLSETTEPMARIARAWKLAFGSLPTEEESRRAIDYLEHQTPSIRGNLETENHAEAEKLALASFCQALFGSNRFLYIE